MEAADAGRVAISALARREREGVRRMVAARGGASPLVEAPVLPHGQVHQPSHVVQPRAIHLPFEGLHLVPVGLGTGFKISGEAEAAAEAAGEGEGEGVPSPRLAYERCLLLHAALRVRSAGALQQRAMTEAWPAEPL